MMPSSVASSSTPSHQGEVVLDVETALPGERHHRQEARQKRVSLGLSLPTEVVVNGDNDGGDDSSNSNEDSYVNGEISSNRSSFNSNYNHSNCDSINSGLSVHSKDRNGNERSSRFAIPMGSVISDHSSITDPESVSEKKKIVPRKRYSSSGSAFLHGRGMMATMCESSMSSIVPSSPYFGDTSQRQLFQGDPQRRISLRDLMFSSASLRSSASGDNNNAGDDISCASGEMMEAMAEESSSFNLSSRDVVRFHESFNRLERQHQPSREVRFQNGATNGDDVGEDNEDDDDGDDDDDDSFGLEELFYDEEEHNFLDERPSIDQFKQQQRKQQPKEHQRQQQHLQRLQNSFAIDDDYYYDAQTSGEGEWDTMFDAVVLEDDDQPFLDPILDDDDSEEESDDDVVYVGNSLRKQKVVIDEREKRLSLKRNKSIRFEDQQISKEVSTSQSMRLLDVFNDEAEVDDRERFYSKMYNDDNYDYDDDNPEEDATFKDVTKQVLSGIGYILFGVALKKGVTKVQNALAANNAEGAAQDAAEMFDPTEAITTNLGEAETASRASLHSSISDASLHSSTHSLDGGGFTGGGVTGGESSASSAGGTSSAGATSSAGSASAAAQAGAVAAQ